MRLFAVRLLMLVFSSTALAAQGAPSMTVPYPPASGIGIGAKSRVDVSLAVDRPVYSYGSSVVLAFTVLNNSSAPVKYQFNSSQKYDVVISNKAGSVIWTWSRNKFFGQLVTNLVLQPGKSKLYLVKWTQRDNEDHPVPSGDYTAVAALLPMSRPRVTGGFFTDPVTDPANTGMPMLDKVQTGSVVIHNATPPLYARTTFTIEPGV